MTTFTMSIYISFIVVFPPLPPLYVADGPSIPYKHYDTFIHKLVFFVWTLQSPDFDILKATYPNHEIQHYLRKINKEMCQSQLWLMSIIWWICSAEKTKDNTQKNCKTFFLTELGQFIIKSKTAFFKNFSCYYDIKT